MNRTPPPTIPAQKTPFSYSQLAILCVITALPLAPAIAQDSHDHNDAAKTDDAIIVTAMIDWDARSALSGVSVVSGDDLARALQPTIGDTLAKTPGVSSTSFGPNVSRPILRGFQGERVRVLTDGIGSFDVSNTSADHAVAINPLTAERIEILRGPTALLFGSSAIGGVVNVIDARIPRTIPIGDAQFKSRLAYGSAADDRSVSASSDAHLGSGILVHVDGSYSRSGNLKTGGFLLSDEKRQLALASPDANIRALADLKGDLPNSAGETRDYAVAFAWIGEHANGGVSVSRNESNYGVPPRYSLDATMPTEMVRLDMGQTRLDGRFEQNFASGPFQAIKFRGGFADYAHSELDESGGVGTRFFAKGGEARIELTQADRGDWHGAVGAQGLWRRMNIVGAEKFLPRNATRQFGIFTMQHLELGDALIEAGLRYEHSYHKADEDTFLGSPDYSHSFDTVSFSLGSGVKIADGWRLGINASRSARAPSAEELYANGFHAGTQAFQYGDPNLEVERNWGLEATVRGHGDGYSFDAALYRTWFTGYIYEGFAGYDAAEGFPIYQIAQSDARYWGFEVEASKRLVHFNSGDIVADGMVDYVHANIQDAGPAPHIPPLRILGGLEWQAQDWSLRGEVEHVTKQSKLAIGETETPAYTMINVTGNWRPFADNQDIALQISLNNLLDVNARRHASFLKDDAPLAGRDVRISLRFGF